MPGTREKFMAKAAAKIRATNLLVAAQKTNRLRYDEALSRDEIIEVTDTTSMLLKDAAKELQKL